MAYLTVNVTLDLANYMRVSRFAEQNQPTLLKTAAQTYLKYQRMRFILASAGDGTWPELKQSTILRKARRRVATNPAWVLREYDALLNALGVKLSGKQVRVGFVRNLGAEHPRTKEDTRGPITIRELIRIHSKRRPMIAAPDRQSGVRMTDDIRKEYNKVIRRLRRNR